MDLELNGKTALVTGGSAGIGKAIAGVLAAEGCDVAIAARNEERLRTAAAEIATASGRRIVPIVADTGDTASVEAMVAAAAAALGRIDILVNNAARVGGGSGTPGIAGVADADFNEDMNVKVLGYVRCARAVAPLMIAQGWGRIINISGLAARQTGNPVGSMRNVAVAALTKNLADELGPHGINVTLVHPGLTWTERMATIMGGGDEESARARMSQQNTVRRVIDAMDIANIVAFLASPKSVAITGDSIAAGGGVGRAIHY